MIEEQKILEVLRKIVDPELGIDIVKLGIVKDIDIRDGEVVVKLELTTPACPFRSQIKDMVEKELMKLPGIQKVSVEISSKVMGYTSRKIPSIKHVIAVASGKGGVGKTTVAVNIALALSEDGASVGILDADMHGPSVPKMLNIQTDPEVVGDRIVPALGYNNVKIMSIGLFLKDEDPVIWRGPLVASAIKQLLKEVDWGELDYLIVDLPPGTGDAPLTLAQTIPLTGVIIVTTPQEVALRIALKALNMFRRMGIEIIGVVENMSYFICPNCGYISEIFGRGGARELCEKTNVQFLGEIPLSMDIRLNGDIGKPILIASPNSPSAEAFRKIARAIAGRVSVISYKKLEGKDINEP